MELSRQYIEDLLSKIDIVDLIGKYVPLQKKGLNFMGLCPFHGEKSPSFSVSQTKQFYHCFGCGKHDDAIGFLVDHLGLSFKDAVDELIKQVGVLPPPQMKLPSKEKPPINAKRKQELSEVLKVATLAYQKQLRSSEDAIEYLKGRGLTGQMAKDYGIGVSPEEWHFLDSVFDNYQSKDLDDAGLVVTSDSQKRYDRFRGRITFPIRNLSGQYVGFGARIFTEKDEPKYINSPETSVFSKGKELYGLYESRTEIQKSSCIIVVEGFLDVITLKQFGISNAVATLGTSCTTEHIQTLLRFVDKVVFAFDGDDAGRTAASRALQSVIPCVTDTKSVSFLFLPDDHDPDSFVREVGSNEFLYAISKATPLSVFLTQIISEDKDLTTAEGKSAYAMTAKKYWTAFKPCMFKQQMIRVFADQLSISSNDLSTSWGLSSSNSTPKTQNQESIKPLTLSDRALKLIISNPQLLNLLTNDEINALTTNENENCLFFSLIEHMQLNGLEVCSDSLIHRLDNNQDVLKIERIITTPDNLANSENTHAELRELIRRIYIEQLKAKETAIITFADSDPMAATKYRELVAHRLSIEATKPTA